MQQPQHRSCRASARALGVLALAVLAAGPTRAANVTNASNRVVALQGVQNFLGKPPLDAVNALGDKAKFVDEKLNAIAASTAQGVILWQSPLPGQPVASTGDVQLLAAAIVPVPELEGMRVIDAQKLLVFRGLALEVVTTCGAQGRPANRGELDWRVQHQCVAPNDVLTVGGHVGVVIQPWPDDGISSLTAFAVGALVGLAAGAALAFFMRRRSS